MNPGAPRHTTGSLAQAVEAGLVGNPLLPIDRLDAIEQADGRTLTFVRSAKYAADFARSEAAAAVISASIPLPEIDPARRALLVVPDADLAMVVLLRLLAPPSPTARPGVHATAVVAASARLGHGVSIGPHCVIGEDAVIGDGAVLVSGVSVGREAEIGALCTLHHGVVVMDRCTLGQGCLLHANAVIGADGFGFRPSPDGRSLVKIPHIGSVVLGAGVEIGAGSCVDRAKFGRTVIGDGTKIDNLVQIGHNCRIGRGCVICAGGMIGGSTVMGDGCMLGGNVSVADNVTLGARTTVGGASNVGDNLEGNAVYGGTPAMPFPHWQRLLVMLRNMHRYSRALKRLEREDSAAERAARG